jgi:hypothetical protein
MRLISLSILPVSYVPYIRGFLPETTDDMLYAYAVRFRKIERCKAIISRALFPLSSLLLKIIAFPKLLLQTAWK